MINRGKVWKFGDHVDTDIIIPARYLNVSDRTALAEHCFEDVRPGFKGDIHSGDVIVAGENFGCGSSREHAAWAIKEAGIALVIAESFARIFFRNAFNIGLPLIELPEASKVFDEGDELSVDLATGKIIRLVDDRVYSAKPIPEFMMGIVEAGGLVPYIKQRKV